MHEFIKKCKVQWEYKQQLGDVERAGYDRKKDAEADLAKARKVARKAEQSQQTLENDSGEAPSLQPRQPADEKPRGEPNSVALWFQTPAKKPEDCISSIPSLICNYSDTRPISVEALRTSLPTQTLLGVQAAAQNFRKDHGTLPKAAPDFPKNVKYPKQCGCIDGYTWHWKKYSVGKQLERALIELMVAVGGFRALLVKDVLARVETVQGGEVKDRCYLWLAKGVGLPQLVDLVRMKVVGGSDNPDSQGVTLTYEREQFVQTRCKHEESLSHGVTLGPLANFTEEEMVEEIMMKATNDLSHVSVAHLYATFTQSDKCILHGVQEEYFPMRICNGNKKAKPCAAAVDPFGAFDDADNPFTRGTTTK